MLHFLVIGQRQRDEFTHQDGPIEFGRAPSDERKTFVVEDRFVSRRQLRVEQLGSGNVQVANLGSSVVTLTDGRVLDTNQSTELALPQRLSMGYSHIEISSGDTQQPPRSVLKTIARPIRPQEQSVPATLNHLGKVPTPEALANWFETLLSVQRAAAGSNEFYAETARAVVDLAGLDRGVVVLRDAGEWATVASHSTQPGLPVDYSRTVLSRVVRERRTFYESSLSQRDVVSLANVEAYVASPIFTAEDEVVGAIFGSRDVKAKSDRLGIEPLEAQLVQLLAGAVSAGLARTTREAEAARLEVQLKQFASPELVRELRRNPDLLEASEREVSVLFVDLRGFSRIAERLEAKDTYRLVRDVMDRLTRRVLEHDGFIMNYAGDGLAAMWNAPTGQPNHATLACRAAIALQAEMPPVNERWGDALGHPLEIGVGISTGAAQVGNAGSEWRLKYAPLGHTVNVASRIEGATKQLGVQILVSKMTREKVSQPLLFRRLVRVRAVGLERPIELYELQGDTAEESWLALRDRYEQALSLYDKHQHAEARAILAALLQDVNLRDDRPTQLLWELANQERPAGNQDAVLVLDGK